MPRNQSAVGNRRVCQRHVGETGDRRSVEVIGSPFDGGASGKSSQATKLNCHAVKEARDTGRPQRLVRTVPSAKTDVPPSDAITRSSRAPRSSQDQQRDPEDAYHSRQDHPHRRPQPEQDHERATTRSGPTAPIVEATRPASAPPNEEEREQGADVDDSEDGRLPPPIAARKLS